MVITNQKDLESYTVSGGIQVGTATSQRCSELAARRTNLSKEEFKRRVLDTYRDKLKTTDQIKHILAQKDSVKSRSRSRGRSIMTPKSPIAQPERTSMNSAATFMRKSMEKD